MYGEPINTALRPDESEINADKVSSIGGYFTLVGAFLIHTTLGSLYSIASLAPFVTSFMKDSNDGNYSANTFYHDGLLIYVLFIIFQGLAGFLGGKLHRTLGATKAAILGGSIMSLGLIMAALSVHSYFLFLISFGIIAAVGNGLSYPIPLACALKWYPTQKGIVSCIIFLGRGLSVCILCPLQSYFLFNGVPSPIRNIVANSPEGDLYVNDASVLQKLPLLFIIMAGGCMMLQLIGSFLLFEPPSGHADTVERRRLISEIRSSPTSLASSLLSSFILTPQEVCTCRSFWVLSLIFFLSWQSLLVVSYLWKVLIFQEAILHSSSDNAWIPNIVSNVIPGMASWNSITDIHISSIGAIAAAFCVAGRLLWGFFGEMSSNKNALFLLNLLLVPMMLLFSAISVKSPYFYAFWLISTHMCQGGLYSLLPALTSDLFGRKNFGPVFALLFLARMGAALSICVITKVLVEYYSYTTLFYYLAALHALAALCSFLFHPTEALPSPYQLLVA